MQVHAGPDRKVRTGHMTGSIARPLGTVGPDRKVRGSCVGPYVKNVGAAHKYKRPLGTVGPDRKVRGSHYWCNIEAALENRRILHLFAKQAYIGPL